MSGDWRTWLGKFMLSIALGGVTVPCGETIVSAQIIPDETLGAKSSVVTPDNIKGLESDRISGGAARGSNLFHSFREFNIGEGRGGYFENPAAIENIFSRVTGSNPSEIFGTLGVLGNANLFFLNPNGILFGPNASLDVRGSFLATTADSILFPDGNQFNATNPEAPPLLTVNVQQPIGLEFEGREGIISHQGNLDVEPGQNLALVGGDVTLDGGSLIAPGGRVELGGLSAAGEIGMNADGSLSFSEGMERADVTLTNAADVIVGAAGGGSINVNARNLELSGGELGASNLRAGIAADSGSSTAQAGDITLNATDSITVSQGSGIANQVASTGVGNSGRINITTANLSLTEGSVVNATTFGQGDGGAITINASETISADGEDRDGFPSGIGSQVAGVGNSGGINITTANLSLTQGGQVSASTFGQGDAGSITINASETVSFEGVGSNGLPSAAFSSIEAGAEGNSGGIEITTGSLSVVDGARLIASTFGQGDAGSIKINASKTVSFDGASPNGIPSLAFSNVSSEAQGNGGNIEITTSSLSVTNGAQISASTFGRGNAGGVIIHADTVSFDESFAFSQVAGTGEGKSGSIEITTGSLSVTNGAQLIANTLGQGDASSVKINARDTVSFDGFNERFPLAISGVATSVESGAVGKGGNIDITAGSLFMTNGAQISSSTDGQGDAGSVRINVHDTVSLDGVGSNGLSSAAFSSIGAGGVGKGGNIDIIADSLFITNGAGLVVSNLGRGDAGDVTIHAKSRVSLDGVGSNGFPSAVFSSVAEDPAGSLENPIGNGGDIQIATDLLTVTNGARLAASTVVGQGDAGGITIEAREISFDGVGSDGPSGAFSAVGSEAVGNGIGINITTESLSLKNGAVLSSSTRGQGDGGNIILNTNTLEALNGGQIITTSFSSNEAGNITLKVTDSITLSGSDPTFFERLAQFDENVEDVVIGVSPNSGLFANTEAGSTGNSGSIFIDPNSVIIRDGAQIAVNSDGSGVGGEINLQADSLTLDRGKITAETASNQGGNINLTLSDLLTLRNNSQITTTAGTNQARGDGGNITIDAPFIIAFPNEDSNIQADAFEGDGGNIRINTNGIFGIEFRDEATSLSDITASSEFGQQGEVEINTSAIDPTRGLNNLPQEAVEAEVAQSCQTVGGKSTLEFFDIGRGGLPPNPDDLFTSETVIAEWIPLDLAEDQTLNEVVSQKEFTTTTLLQLSCH